MLHSTERSIFTGCSRNSASRWPCKVVISIPGITCTRYAPASAWASQPPRRSSWSVIAMTSRSVSSDANRRISATLSVPSPQVVWTCKSALPIRHLGPMPGPLTRAENGLKCQPLVWPAPNEFLERGGHALGLGMQIGRWDERGPHVRHDAVSPQTYRRAEDHGGLVAGSYGEGQRRHAHTGAEEGHFRSVSRQISVADDGHDLVAVQCPVYLAQGALAAHDYAHSTPAPKLRNEVG